MLAYINGREQENSIAIMNEMENGRFVFIEFHIFFFLSFNTFAPRVLRWRKKTVNGRLKHETLILFFRFIMKCY